MKESRITDKGNNNFFLTKSSSEQELKNYFNAVLKLAKSDNEFPINLDDVWMLVYSERSKAVRALKDNFIEGFDYQPFAQNGNRSSDGKFSFGNQTEYFLSLSCMEFFIARKVRSVFEVYRQVFHGVANGTLLPKKQSKPRKQGVTLTKVRAAIEWVNGLSKSMNLNDASKLLFFEKVGKPLELPVPDYTPSKGVLKSASALLQENKVDISTQKFNQILMEKGLLKEMTRQSSKGERKFKNLTEQGMQYGENQVNPQNPKETQPLYYVDKFDELLALVGITPQAELF